MDMNYKIKVDKLVYKAKQKGLVKTYVEVCESAWGKENMLSEEEANYYAYSKKLLNITLEILYL